MTPPARSRIPWSSCRTNAWQSASHGQTAYELGITVGTVRSYTMKLRRSHPAGSPLTVALDRFDPIVSRGLMQILHEDPDIVVIGIDLDSAAIERVIVERTVRVAILNEASVLARGMAKPGGVGVVVLVDNPTHARGLRLLAAGTSCLPQHASAADVLSTVRDAAEGRNVFMPAHEGRQEQVHIAKVPLTPRETEVLEYLGKGYTNAEIALALSVGIETVRTHSARIRTKFGVRNKRALIGLTARSC